MNTWATLTVATLPLSSIGLVVARLTGRLGRVRRRVDALLAEMLGDAADKVDAAEVAGSAHRPDETFWGPQALPDRRDATAAGYRSKHRARGAGKESAERPDGRRRAPRHAAPSASLGARIARAHAGAAR